MLQLKRSFKNSMTRIVLFVGSAIKDFLTILKIIMVELKEKTVNQWVLQPIWACLKIFNFKTRPRIL
jgi:hypothetical protein